MEGLYKLTNVLSNGTIPDRYGLLFPQDLGSQPPPKTQIAISGMGEATDFKFGLNIHRVNSNKSPPKILEKRERERIQGLPIFLDLRNMYELQILYAYS